MVAMTHGRAQLQQVSLGAKRDGTLVGLEVDLIGDAGAYPAIGAYLPLLTGQMACGVYDLRKAFVRARAASTNTSVIAAYRGAGRPEATALIERAMDMLADELGMDPADLRRRNLITPPFPHDTPTGVSYDSGDYVRALDVALAAAHYEDLLRDQEVRRNRGDRIQLGIGISCYVEVTAGGTPMEHATARVDAEGIVTVLAGTTSSGQGHETAFAQLAAALLDVPMESVRVIESDTGVVKSGDGSYFSRSLQLGGSAVRGACISVIEKAREEAARRLEANIDDIVRLEGGRFGVRGVPTSSLGWADLASEGVLAAEEDFVQTDQTFPFGCHIAVVEVDIETGEARLVRHIAVDDCGTILNPMLVEGQIHGGVAQGIGEIPVIETLHTETPSPHNPLGAKGVGESGTIGSTPAVQNAVIDAVSHLGVRHIDMPCHPMRVWEAIQAATARS
jgi:carbon-monoxide dehydrogenase large subunit